VNLLRELLSDIRNRLVELEVKPKEKVPIRIFTTSAVVRKMMEMNRDLIGSLAMVDRIEFAGESMSRRAGVQTRNVYELAVIYEKKIDFAVERDRLSKELKKQESEFTNTQRQLGNEGFLAKAPASVVDGLRRRHAELQQLLQKTRVALEELEKGAASSNGTHG